MLQLDLPYILAYKPTPIPGAENVAKISDAYKRVMKIRDEQIP